MSKTETTVAGPPITSLQDWHVGATDNGMCEVRIVLSDKDEAGAWAIWLLERREDATDVI